jgi:hypothetical protein
MANFTLPSQTFAKPVEVTYIIWLNVFSVRILIKKLTLSPTIPSLSLHQTGPSAASLNFFSLSFTILTLRKV